MRARQSAVSVPTPYSTSKVFFAGATVGISYNIHDMHC